MHDENNILKQAVKELAPCGLDCSRCVDFKDGEISTLCLLLLEKLKGYEHIAELSKNFTPVLSHYNDFLEILTHFSKAQCIGCHHTATGGCGIRSCHQSHHINFCFECSNYPCHPRTFNEFITQKWRANNDQMKDKGVEAFYLEQKQKPRY